MRLSSKESEEIAVLTIHGIGNQPQDYYQKFHERLYSLLTKKTQRRVKGERIYYQKILSHLQEEVRASLYKTPLRWKPLRSFAIHYLSDAVTYEHRIAEKESPYQRISEVIYDSVKDLKAQLRTKNPTVVVIAHSFGCHVITNYLYDAQKGKYFWKNRKGDRFDKLQNIRLFLTTGCNIPLFVGGLENIQPFSRPNDHFEWYNYYDKDDVLGWPLKVLTRGRKRPYENIVTKDIPVRTGITPLDSHVRYWKSRKLTEMIVERIASLYRDSIVIQNAQ